MIGLRRSAAIFTVFVMVAVFVLPSSTLAAEVSGENLSIQQALDTAYMDNPDLRAADLSVDSAQLSRDKAVENVTYIPSGGMISPSYQGVMNSYQQTEINLTTAKKKQSMAKDSVSVSVISDYAQAISSANSMQLAKLTLDDLMTQQRISAISKSIGMVSDTDYNQILNGIIEQQQAYDNAQSSYKASISALANLLGKSQDWQPVLTSRAALETYPRQGLTAALADATAASTTLLTQNAQLQIAENTKTWVITSSSPAQQQNSIDQAQTSVQQTLRSVSTSVQQLYYNIDSLEGQIKIAETSFQQDQDNLKNAQLKYDLGLIPQYSTGTASLETANLAVEKDQLSLDSMRASMASAKANFTYLTGKTIYDENDWTADQQQATAVQSAKFRINSTSYDDVKGVASTMDVAPYIKASRTYVPLRYLGLALGVAEGDIVWDAAAQTATLSLGSTKVVFTIGSTTYTVNGAAKTMDVAPEITNGRTMLPARYAAEGLGYTAGWDSATQTVSVSK
jgi:outer membrane protein TolC